MNTHDHNLLDASVLVSPHTLNRTGGTDGRGLTGTRSDGEADAAGQATRDGRLGSSAASGQGRGRGPGAGGGVPGRGRGSGRGRVSSGSRTGQITPIVAGRTDEGPSEVKPSNPRTNRNPKNRGRGGKGSNKTGESNPNPNAHASARAQHGSGSAPRVRPTHFLALPLHNFPELRKRIAHFQDSLFEPPPLPSSAFPSATTSLSPCTSDSSFTNSTLQNFTLNISPRSIDPLIRPSDTLQVELAQGRGKERRKGKARTPARASPSVQGLDSTIAIDPRRMHMTLGVMALSPLAEGGKGVDVDVDEAKRDAPTSIPETAQATLFPAPETASAFGPASTPTSTLSPSPASIPESQAPPNRTNKKTVQSALSILASLKPRISAILNGSKGVTVPLEVLDVLKTSRMPAARSVVQGGASVDESRAVGASAGADAGEGEGEVGGMEGKGGRERVGAGVLFVGPRGMDRSGMDEERRKLMDICLLVNTAFKEAGYLTDTRPLKLHCTILNASHRKPARWIPFCYTDILKSQGMTTHLGAQAQVPIPGSSSGSGWPGAGRVNPEPDAETRSAPLVQCPNPAVKVDNADTPKRTFRAPLQSPPPIPIDLGSYRVTEIQLWEMGSRGVDGGYISYGGVVLE